MEGSKVIIEEAEHVVTGGTLEDDINEGGNYSTESSEDKFVEDVEVEDEEIEEVEEDEKDSKDELIAKIEAKLTDLKQKYENLLARFDELIESGATVKEDVVEDEEIDDDTMKSIEDLDFRVDKWA